ncbi:MAG: hypothetical protein GTO51_03140 [Candidatus Latescibacteria bacterium]|nr:hypothetical protein [Candidatus Latescibacterota bacterium]NIM22680.1 hypothetical protein [Candidatus Latescibacterota bacterium]NIM64969.1 hypothetical protein [Candidatus Latescibacterota bacterium]NIO01484.1 hypothetical protein [Candidatus Latescibacterota bacterium]NIO27994.1 hypothetical protein [Candidatus Latescibacterota bacterium]
MSEKPISIRCTAKLTSWVTSRLQSVPTVMAPI